MIFFHNTPLSTSIPQPFHRKTAVIHVFSAEPKRFSTIPIVETVENLFYSSLQSVITHENAFISRRMSSAWGRMLRTQV